MAIVADKPRKSGAFLLRKRRKAQTGSQTITVDLWSHRGYQEICLLKSARDLHDCLRWVTELGFPVPLHINADDASECLCF